MPGSVDAKLDLIITNVKEQGNAIGRLQDGNDQALSLADGASRYIL